MRAPMLGRKLFIQLTGRGQLENGEFPGVFFVRNALQSALLRNERACRRMV